MNRLKKGHFEISASAFAVNIGIRIGAAKIFLKKYKIYVQCNLYSLLCLTVFSVSITSLLLLISLRFPIHYRHSTKHPSISVSEKKDASKSFGNLPVKHLWWSPFQVYLQALLGVLYTLKKHMLHSQFSSIAISGRLDSSNRLKNLHKRRFSGNFLKLSK